MPDLRDDLAAYIDELADRAEHAVGDGSGPVGRQNPPDRRPMLAMAAAAVVVAAVAAVALGLPSGDGGDDRTVASDRGVVTVVGEEIPVPGTERFDPSAAPPVWPVLGEARLPELLRQAGGLGEPRRAAAAYLDDVAGPPVIELGDVSVAQDGRTATVRWFQDSADGTGRPRYEGAIYLREVGTPERPLWVVVGAATDGGTIGDVRSDGHRVGFLLLPAATDEAESLAVRVWGGEDYSSVGGTPLPQGPERPDPDSGELVRHGTTSPTAIHADVESGATVEILVRHVGGTWLSLTHLAFPAPPA